MKKVILLAIVSPLFLVAGSALASMRIQNACVATMTKGVQSYMQPEVIGNCKCAARHLDEAGITPQEEASLARAFDMGVVAPILKRKDGELARADACLRAVSSEESKKRQQYLKNLRSGAY